MILYRFIQKVQDKFQRTIAIAICFMIGTISINLAPISQSYKLNLLCIKYKSIDKLHKKEKRYNPKKIKIENSILKIISHNSREEVPLICHTEIK